MTDFETSCKLQKLISIATNRKNDLNIAMIASNKEKTNLATDYTKHSVRTSYLSMLETDELLGYFRNFGAYIKVYFDIEAFIEKFYKMSSDEKPNLIFETSSKGIGRGRDALIPCLCDIWNIKHLGSSSNINCLCSSKYQWSSVLKSHNISVPNSHFFTGTDWATMPSIGNKYILKLNYECASIGLSNDSVIINDGANLNDLAKKQYNDYLQPIIAQKFIEGYEVEVPLIKNNHFKCVLPPVGISYNDNKNLSNLFLNYETIYNDNYSFYRFDSVNFNASKNIQECVSKIIDILDLDGYMRVDFRVDNSGNFYVIDINNDPSITSSGSFLFSLECLGFDSADIVPILIGNCII